MQTPEIVGDFNISYLSPQLYIAINLPVGVKYT